MYVIFGVKVIWITSPLRNENVFFLSNKYVHKYILKQFYCVRMSGLLHFLIVQTH